jgi:hypothetical protein
MSKSKLCKRGHTGRLSPTNGTCLECAAIMRGNKAALERWFASKFYHEHHVITPARQEAYQAAARKEYQDRIDAQQHASEAAWDD